ncbi:MAG TPA: tetratricopeptide repeat protein [Thermoanaerobaculia bacterium]|jgi:tetratricopeptide (TPR) repeat protein|nr:tetratricopeptide repeat protein [Thermoanaerobaculia bacterium]
MTDAHVSDERLMVLADESRSDAEIDAHVASCAACAGSLDFYRLLNAEMKDAESWRIEEEVRTRRGARPIADFAARIESEDAAAVALVDELRERLARDPNADIADDPRFLTGGVVRALEALGLEQSYIDPFLAEMFARVGCIVAEALPDDYYPANAVFELRGRAWVLHSSACSNIDRYDEALEDADRGERAYEQLPDPGSGLASVKLARALVYLRLERFSEGFPLAKSAADEYERRGERYKYAGALDMTAALHHMTGERAAALEINLAVLEAADELHDAELRARTLHNIGQLHRKVGNLEESGKYLLDALHMYEGLGQKAGAAYCRWSIGVLALSRADFIEAEKVLRSAIDAMREVGAERFAAGAKLDLAEALLMLGRPQEIETLCREAEAVYAKAGSLSGHLAAARFLRNAAANQMLRRDDVEHVRTYLESSRGNPDRPFAPPPRRRGPGSEH